MVANRCAVAGIDPVDPAAMTGPSLASARRAASAEIKRSRRGARSIAPRSARIFCHCSGTILKKFAGGLPVRVEVMGEKPIKPVPGDLARRHIVDQAREIIGEGEGGRRTMDHKWRLAAVTEGKLFRPLLHQLCEQHAPLQWAQ